MDSMLSALHKGYNKTFQCQLLAHLVRDPSLLKMALENLLVTDFELAICQVVWEAAADYYRTFKGVPDMNILQLQVMKVVQNADNKFKSYITPEEMEGLADLLVLVANTSTLNSEYFKVELPKYIKWVRTSKIIGDYSSSVNSGGDPAKMVGQLTAIERTVDSAFVTGKPFSFISNDMELITAESLPQRVTTGVPKLDAILSGGLEPGEIGLITACPGVGKSNILTHFTVAANYAGIKSLLITLELSGAKIKRRYTAMAAGIQADRLKEPVEMWKEEDLYRLYMFTRPEYVVYGAAAVSEQCKSRISITKVEAIIEEWRAHWRQCSGTDTDALLVCIDWQKYLTMPKGTRPAEHWEESDLILKELGFIAKRQHVVIWTANQGGSQADGKSILRMNDTAFGYHANDAVDVAIGVGLGARSKVTEENLEAGNAANDRHLVFSINKNRNGPYAACEIYRPPTLRLFDNEAAYASHRAATKCNTYRMINLFNTKDPATVLRDAKAGMPPDDQEQEESANAS